jgi:hypothetical protein
MELVYKYLPPERETFLSDGLLRMTQPGDLNDPFECLSFYPDIDPVRQIEDCVASHGSPRIESSTRELDTLIQVNVGSQIALIKASNPSAKAKAVRKYCEDFFLPGPNGSIGIVSFSRRWTSSTMWAHYAQKHSGYCVGVDRNHKSFHYAHPKMPTGSMRDVDYIAERPVYNMEDKQPSLDEILFTKSTDWEYEQEFRIAYALTDCDKKDGPPANSPTQSPLHLKRFDAAAVKEIMLGYNANEKLRDSVLAFAKTHHIPAFRMQLSSTTSFAMEREPIA